jgi:hypothetical protein
MMRTVAIVTMVYNEPELLPIWLKYYKGHFGDQACYIVDDGSTQESITAQMTAPRKNWVGLMS